MKRILILPVLLLTLLVGNPAFSADFQKGLTAAQSGDFATALREWEPLAKQGNADAQHNTGLIFYNGNGLPQNYIIAIKWFSLAAEQGDFRAQNLLGKIYERGRGVPKDYMTAVKWYRLAAEQGDARAQSNLGLMYAAGRGVTQQNAYAYMWGNLAASNGSEYGGKVQDFVAKRMTPADISSAQNLARECVRKKYKGC
jgi:TPR repeat protein